MGMVKQGTFKLTVTVKSLHQGSIEL